MHRASEILEENVSVHRIIGLAEQADGVCLPEKQEISVSPFARLGVARDEAFCFYYEENLKALKKAGAELVFSPLHDAALPDGIDGLLLGGGYPELYADKLEENAAMRQSVRNAIENGMPSVAECGGFMYLHETLTDDTGKAYAMCGVISGKCFYTGKLVRFGYISIEEKNPCFLQADTMIKGHEFHYYDSDHNGQDCTARKPVTGRAWDCIHETKSSFWGFPHLYYASNPEFVFNFISAAGEFHDRMVR